jgi:hypothetical protein
MTQNTYPRWFTPSDCAKADSLTYAFVDAARSHAKTCPLCFSQPCDRLREMIDAVHAEIEKIGHVSFPLYVESVERKYGPRDFRA